MRCTRGAPNGESFNTEGAEVTEKKDASVPALCTPCLGFLTSP